MVMPPSDAARFGGPRPLEIPLRCPLRHDQEGLPGRIDDEMTMPTRVTFCRGRCVACVRGLISRMPRRLAMPLMAGARRDTLLPMTSSVDLGQPSLDSLESAAALVYESMPATPQYRWPLLESRVGAEVWAKHENHMPTGSFKVRGGIVYFDDLCLTGKPAGVVQRREAITDNQSALLRVNRIPATIVVPHGNASRRMLPGRYSL